MADATALVRPGDKVDIRFTACGECGAVIDVILNGVTVFPGGSELHEEWHRGQR